jgi:hypothetical protein
MWELCSSSRELKGLCPWELTHFVRGRYFADVGIVLRIALNFLPAELALLPFLLPIKLPFSFTNLLVL